MEYIQLHHAISTGFTPMDGDDCGYDNNDNDVYCE